MNVSVPSVRRAVSLALAALAVTAFGVIAFFVIIGVFGSSASRGGLAAFVAVAVTVWGLSDMQSRDHDS